MERLPRKLKKKLKLHATKLYIKPKLKYIRITNFNKTTLDYEMTYVK